MSDANPKNSQKGSKVGADGLTKKERRAQKVKSAGNTTNTNVNVNANAGKGEGVKVSPEKPQQQEQQKQNNSPVIVKKDAPAKSPSTAAKATKENTAPKANNAQNNKNVAKEKQQESNKVIENSTANKPQDEKNAEGKTKAELKAERRAQIEKELALKKTEKGKEEGTLSKAELKAQRRALQEKQREAKQAAPATNKKESDKKLIVSNKSPEGHNKKSPSKKSIKPQVNSKPKHPHYEMIEHMTYTTPVDEIKTIRDNIHPAFSEFGVQTSFKTIKGANARALGLIHAMIKLIRDFKTPPNQEYCRSLENSLQDSVDFLAKCRPLSAGMSNIIRAFKMKLTKVDRALSDSEKRKELLHYLEMYVENEIDKASEAISLKTLDKISNGDVILTYGCSSLVQKILTDAKNAGKEFSVMVADSRPFTEGRILLTRLNAMNIPCSFVLLTAVSTVMHRVSKILLGAHSLLSNGFVMSRVGTGQLSMIAKDFHKPVLICCETYKFCERVQTDSYVVNEIGDSKLLEKISFLEEPNALDNWKSTDNVIPLHLVYDVAIPDVISAVITELGILPCTSVPVVLRYKTTEM